MTHPWKLAAFIAGPLLLGAAFAWAAWDRAANVGQIKQHSTDIVTLQTDVQELKAKDAEQDAALIKLEADRLVARVTSACGPAPGPAYFAADDPPRWEKFDAGHYRTQIGAGRQALARLAGPDGR